MRPERAPRPSLLPLTLIHVRTVVARDRALFGGEGEEREREEGHALVCLVLDDVPSDATHPRLGGLCLRGYACLIDGSVVPMGPGSANLRPTHPVGLPRLV